MRPALAALLVLGALSAAPALWAADPTAPNPVVIPAFQAPAPGSLPTDAPGKLVLDRPAITVLNPTHAAYETVARAGDRLVAGGEHGLIVLSDDDGATWRQAAVPVSATITRIAFADPRNGWAIGSFGVVLHTSDAGANWVLQLDGIRAAQIMVDTAKALPAAPADAAAPQPLPGQAQVAAVPERLRRALSFQADGPDKPFFVLSVADADHARIIGAYDMAFETADGGKTWTEWDSRIDDKGDLHPYGLAGSGASTVLAGEQGMLLRGDPAQRLVAVTSPYDGSFFGALDGGRAGLFVYGLLGHLYRSTDGGATWSQITDPSPATLTCGVSLGNGDVLFGDLRGDIWRLSGSALVKTGANQQWPITAMVEAPDGSLIVAGLGGLQRVAAHAVG